MLPKIHRLTKKKDFDVVFKGGKSVGGAFLMVKILKSNLGESRFGFVVSKKVSPKATVRNKVKRRLREAVACEIKNMKGARDVIIVALPGVQKQEFSVIREMVKNILSKI